jgi:Protein of unknown function (DUF2971)
LAARAAKKTQHSDAYAAQLEAIRAVKAENLDLMEIRIFSASLTELPDDVPQWRSYAADGRGVALGFDTDSIAMLKVPYYNHTSTGDLIPYRSPHTNEAEMGKATLAKVGYGDAARESAIRKEIRELEQDHAANNFTFGDRLFNCICIIPLQLGDLARIKHEGFQSEEEWRLTIQEHLPTEIPSQNRALNKLIGAESDDVFPLTTVDVKFREGGPALFKPYTALPFEKSALVKVVLGPNVNAELATPVTRRLLDRHGFQHTEIVPSALPYRT